MSIKEKFIKNSNELNKELINEYEKLGFFKRIFGWKYIIKSIFQKVDLFNKNQILLFDENPSEIKELNSKVSKLKVDLEITKSEKQRLESDLINVTENIQQKTEKLLSIFDSSLSNQGKFGEIKIENILRNFFENDNLWTKNLRVGEGVVEFGLKTSSNDKKWIPVDSKVLLKKSGYLDNEEDGINNDYISRLSVEVKKVKKYINHNNTREYAILVLQNEHIYLELFKKFSPKIVQWNAENVFIVSPNMFIQFINAISNLSNMMEKVENSKQIIEKIKLIEKHIKSFFKASKESVDKIQIAFNTHLKNIEKNIDEMGKIEQIENNELEDE